MARRKIGVTMMMHETNTFSPVTSSDLALFTYRNRRRPLYPFETA